MKAISTLIVAGCLVCAAPLAQACDMQHEGGPAGHSFKEMDKNGDGAVSKKEFDAFHSAHFKDLDANHDGKITQEEMDSGHMTMTDKCKVKMKDKCDVQGDKGVQSFDDRFDEVDINHDGALSKDEAEIGMPMLFKHFDEIDTNKDGKISKEEIGDYMKQLHEKMHGKPGEGMLKREQ
jgi:Ca2+-binding EF-hand superfamily protein